MSTDLKMAELKVGPFPLASLTLAPTGVWTWGHGFNDTFFSKRTFDHFIGKSPNFGKMRVLYGRGDFAPLHQWISEIESPTVQPPPAFHDHSCRRPLSRENGCNPWSSGTGKSWHCVLGDLRPQMRGSRQACFNDTSSPIGIFSRASMSERLDEQIYKKTTRTT